MGVDGGREGNIAMYIGCEEQGSSGSIVYDYGLATGRSGLDLPQPPQVQRIFPLTFLHRLALGTTQYWGPFPWGKARSGVTLTTHPSAEVKNE
jgi:hypothetical protein